MTEINCCQNLWNQFSRLKIMRDHCADNFRLVQTVGVQHLEAAKRSLVDFEASTETLRVLWDNSFVTLPKGDKMFGPEYAAAKAFLESIPKWSQRPNEIDRIIESRFHISDGRTTHIDLKYMDYDDISFLKNMKNITALETSQSSQEDVNIISELSSLKALDLSTTTAEDLSPLGSLQNLKELTLYGGDNFKDISFAAKLADLNKLDLGNCFTLTDISPLSGLTNLKDLVLTSSSRQTDFSALGRLVSIESLILAHTKISDVSVISDMSKLEKILLTGCKIKDISGMSNLVNLKTVSIEMTEVEDIAVFEKLPNLEMVNIAKTPALKTEKAQTTIQLLKDRGVTVMLGNV